MSPSTKPRDIPSQQLLACLVVAVAYPGQQFRRGLGR